MFSVASTRALAFFQPTTQVPAEAGLRTVAPLWNHRGMFSENTKKKLRQHKDIGNHMKHIINNEPDKCQQRNMNKLRKHMGSMRTQTMK